jgi:tRNA modification GTPase
VVLLVIDGSQPLTAEDEQLLNDTAAGQRLIVINKRDLPAMVAIDPDVRVSALTGAGITELRAAIVSALTGREPLRDSAAVSNVRHIALLQSVRVCLASARAAAAAGATAEEFVLADLQAARGHLDEIVGVRTSDDLLQHIFSSFCIGK